MHNQSLSLTIWLHNAEMSCLPSSLLKISFCKEGNTCDMFCLFVLLLYVPVNSYGHGERSVHLTNKTGLPLISCQHIKTGNKVSFKKSLEPSHSVIKLLD